MAWTQQATDNFTRANSSGLGANWTNHLSSADIVSNTARAHATSTVADPVYSAVTLANDQYAEMKLSVLASGQFASCGVRMSSSASAGYLAIVQGPLGATAQVGIQRHNDNNYLVGAGLTTVTVNAGDTVRLEAAGSTLSLYVNGVLVRQGTDATATSGRAGLTFFTNVIANLQFTFFACGDWSGTFSPDIVGQYDFTEGSGTTLNDTSGAANHGTLGSGGNAPTWIAGGSGGLLFSGGQYVSLPSGLNAAGLTIQVFMDYQSEADPNTYSSPICGNDASHNASNGILLTKQGNGTGTALARAITGGARVWTFGPSGVSSINRGCHQGPGDVALVMDTNDRIYCNGAERINANTSNYFKLAACGAQTSGNYQIGGAAANAGFASQTYFTGKIYYVLIFKRKLSATEIANNSAALASAMATRGITAAQKATSSASQLVADGDSITAGYDGSTGLTPWTASLTLAGSWNIANQGKASLRLSELNTDSDQVVDPLYHPNAYRKLCVVWAGTNDMAGSILTAAQTYAQLQTYCTARRAKGWKVIVVNMISRNGNGTGGATNDSLKNSYNALIAAGVGTDFDALADLSTSGVFNLCADGANTNATYFQADHIHPTQAAHTNVIAPIINAAINQLLPAARVSCEWSLF